METKASLIQGPVMPLLFRTRFPQDFIFGTASASYQYEGAAHEDGRADSIWDTFTKDSEKVKDGSNGDKAIDFYHLFKTDVQIMKEMGLKAFRFSISWSRVLPNVKHGCRGYVNEKGIKFYKDLIKELKDNGITPFVTLFHWDLPQTLEDEYKGFLDEKIVDDFRDFAEFCFETFGDEVTHWITLNEPWSFSYYGYGTGTGAPGHSSRDLEEIKTFIPSTRCSYWRQHNISEGDSATEPYKVAHNMLLAHAAAVKSYKDYFQSDQKGVIGITLVANYPVPKTQSKRDIDAAKRYLDFMFGWFMEPLTTGDYPKIMKDKLKQRLPYFRVDQSNDLKGSFDFLGLNYYTANYAADSPRSVSDPQSVMTDPEVEFSGERDGVPIGEKGCSDWVYNYPKGLLELLRHVKTYYRDPIIYITENGTNEANSEGLSHGEALYDMYRVSYHYNHLYAVEQAMKKHGVKVKGYFAWSLLDNFEWSDGYTVRFGMNYIDYKNELKRHQKLSAIWFSILLKEPYVAYYALNN